MDKFIFLIGGSSFVVMSLIGLRSLHKSKVTTALDRSSPVGRVTGRIYYHGYGKPFVYLETAEYREEITENPEPNDIADVRQAGKRFMVKYNSSGQRWNIVALLINVTSYLAVSIGVTVIIQAFLGSSINSDNFLRSFLQFKSRKFHNFAGETL